MHWGFSNGAEKICAREELPLGQGEDGKVEGIHLNHLTRGRERLEIRTYVSTWMSVRGSQGEGIVRQGQCNEAYLALPIPIRSERFLHRVILGWKRIKQFGTVFNFCLHLDPSSKDRWEEKFVLRHDLTRKGIHRFVDEGTLRKSA